MQTIKSPEELRGPLLSLVVFDVVISILYLFALGPLVMVIGLLIAAAIYFLIVNNLTVNVGVAKVTALVLAILAGLDLLLAFASMSSGAVAAPVTFMIIGADLTNLSMLGYAFIQLSGLQGAQPSATPQQPPTPLPQSMSAPPASPDVMEQIKKLGDLRAANLLTEAEFQAKKAELLKRI